MYGEPGRIDRMRARNDRLAFDIDLDQRRRRYLLEHHVIGIYQEVVIRPRHSRRKMSEDQIIPAIERNQTICRGKVYADLPFLIAHHGTDFRVRTARIVIHQGCHCASLPFSIE